MKKISRRQVGIVIFIFLYPIANIFLNNVPNPMVPESFIALNMIFPILCGFLYGPKSGFISGALGLGISTLIFGSLYDAAGVLPCSIMGYVAGVIGKKGVEFTSSLSIFLGHTLNLIFFYRMGFMKFNINEFGPVFLGVIAESTIDILAIVLLGYLLKKKFYEVNRW
ncbi:ECF transporter S component [Clostridium vincentii]|uniref:Rod shape-determining protein MreD n=1 Tax=Clostridium vincentii TaxID=52704 RepID=A0A2T0BFY6_9CLOT|nr:ECF transporter S component [Clostridium vincentii]PRR82743.1 hypothetical protein CLVI_15530 [Clostridium vincentii]